MTSALHLRRQTIGLLSKGSHISYRAIHTSPVTRASDPRIDDLDLGHKYHDEFAALRDTYDKPKYPIVLAHGLFGFDELRLAGPLLPSVQYWRGVRDALEANDIEVITTAVPPSGSIEERGEKLAEIIASQAQGKSVNIIAHSMVQFGLPGQRVDGPAGLRMHRGTVLRGCEEVTTDGLSRGLDSRYMISQLKPPNVDVKSLTTIATPHRGSAFADYVMEQIGAENLTKVYGLLRTFRVDTGAFAQLTRKYMQEEFNPKTPDREGVKYYSYGATLEPERWSSFKQLHDLVEVLEKAPNDGLVSVPSSKWGTYKGTITGVSHLDLINWTSRVKWTLYSLIGYKPTFNAIAFYLDICDMLAKEGL